jgi:hypothetical protein
LRPDVIFWFVYEIPQVHHQGSVWHPLSLYDEAGRITDVGRTWLRRTR